MPKRLSRPKAVDIEGDPFKLEIDEGSKDYAALSAFATFKTVFSSADNSSRAIVTLSSADFTPEMARTYDVGITLTFGADSQTVSKTFTIHVTYLYLNGTRVIDYSNG